MRLRLRRSRRGPPLSPQRRGRCRRRSGRSARLAPSAARLGVVKRHRHAGGGGVAVAAAAAAAAATRQKGRVRERLAALLLRLTCKHLTRPQRDWKATARRHRRHGSARELNGRPALDCAAGAGQRRTRRHRAQLQRVGPAVGRRAADCPVRRLRHARSETSAAIRATTAEVVKAGAGPPDRSAAAREYDESQRQHYVGRLLASLRATVSR